MNGDVERFLKLSVFKVEISAQRLVLKHHSKIVRDVTQVNHSKIVSLCFQIYQLFHHRQTGRKTERQTDGRTHSGTAPYSKRKLKRM